MIAAETMIGSEAPNFVRYCSGFYIYFFFHPRLSNAVGPSHHFGASVWRSDGSANDLPRYGSNQSAQIDIGSLAPTEKTAHGCNALGVFLRVLTNK